MQKLLGTERAFILESASQSSSLSGSNGRGLKETVDSRVYTRPLLEQSGCQSNDQLRSIGRPEQVSPGIDHKVGLFARRTDVIEFLVNILDAPDILEHPSPLTLLQVTDDELDIGAKKLSRNLKRWCPDRRSGLHL